MFFLTHSTVSSRPPELRRDNWVNAEEGSDAQSCGPGGAAPAAPASKGRIWRIGREPHKMQVLAVLLLLAGCRVAAGLWDVQDVTVAPKLPNCKRIMSGSLLTS